MNGRKVTLDDIKDLQGPERGRALAQFIFDNFPLESIHEIRAAFLQVENHGGTLHLDTRNGYVKYVPKDGPEADGHA